MTSAINFEVNKKEKESKSEKNNLDLQFNPDEVLLTCHNDFLDKDDLKTIFESVKTCIANKEKLNASEYCLETLLKHRYNVNSVIFFLGEIHYYKKEYAEASHHYEVAISNGVKKEMTLPEFFGAALHFIKSLFETHDYEKGAQVCELVLKLHKNEMKKPVNLKFQNLLDKINEEKKKKRKATDLLYSNSSLPISECKSG